MEKAILGTVLFLLLFLGTLTPAYAGSDGGQVLGSLLGALVGILVLVAIFLVIREVMCWYWKINERVALLKDIRRALQSPDAFVSPDDARRTARGQPVMETTKCPKCGQTYMGDLRGQFCESCGERL